MLTRRIAQLAAALLFALTVALPLTPAAAAQSSAYSCTRKTDGTLWCWGS
jgi:hypothetical protein